MKVAFEVLAVARLNSGQQLKEARRRGASIRDVFHISVAFVLYVPRLLTIVPKLRRSEVDVLLDRAGDCATTCRDGRHALWSYDSMITPHSSDQKPVPWKGMGAHRNMLELAGLSGSSQQETLQRFINRKRFDCDPRERDTHNGALLN
ncbi:hypothetical protein [Zoogloea sp.]|uniref:hypothetical protein n=1 Tax=Zoogloea sp. TaxID=49181 RepID=UPI001AC6DFDB|nr:hypothetical protein [Zoogloea sp.]MBN8284547.1 hypothetical protein [Zoogloea sp.]